MTATVTPIPGGNLATVTVLAESVIVAGCRPEDIRHAMKLAYEAGRIDGSIEATNAVYAAMNRTVAKALG